MTIFVIVIIISVAVYFTYLNMCKFRTRTQWDILSENYRAYYSDYLLVKKSFKSGLMKLGNYYCTPDISIAINEKGLFLRSLLMYRIWCPTLLIPFEEIDSIEIYAGRDIPSKIIGKIIGGPFLKFTLSKVPDINIYIVKRIFENFKIPKDLINKSNGILSGKQ